MLRLIETFRFVLYWALIKSGTGLNLLQEQGFVETPAIIINLQFDYWDAHNEKL